MLNKILLTICLFALSTQIIHSQTLSVPINENFIKGRVKQMDEFFARFNMEETWDGHKIANKSDKDYRRKYLATLFDESQFRKNNGSMDNLASSFISEVVEKNYMLN